MICYEYVMHPNLPYFQSVYHNSLLCIEDAYNKQIQTITDIYTQRMQEVDDQYNRCARELNWDVERCQKIAVEAWCLNPTPEETLICDAKYKEFTEALNKHSNCRKEHMKAKEVLDIGYRNSILKLNEQRLVSIQNLQCFHSFWVKRQIYYLQNAGYSYVGNS